MSNSLGKWTVRFLLCSGSSLFYIFSLCCHNTARASSLPSADGRSMRAIAVKNRIQQPPIPPGTEDKTWVRIGLKIAEYSQVNANKENNSPAITKIRRHTLRAKLTRTNHFFFGPYHIQTRPAHWNRKSQYYETHISVFRRFGKDNQVEEPLGNLTLKGTLKGKEQLFTLHGVSHKVFRNKLKQAVLGITAGYHQPKQKGVLATGAKTGVSKR